MGGARAYPRAHRVKQKRASKGKPPLTDFHIVELNRRPRASSSVVGTTDAKLRLHFRRGHWRHFDTHKTWINWTLVGNPDLGWIDKEYRI